MKNCTFGRFPALGYAASEAINTLCTNLSFAGENVRKIMMTSCHASEGKSFLSMNVMRTMAERGKRVVLVDADLRRSMIASRYGLRFEDGPKCTGLSHYLVGMAELDDILYQTNIPNAVYLPTGRELPNPLSLLASPRFGALLDTLVEQYDLVLVDAPPVGVVIDAAEIARSCDGTVIAVSYDAVHRQELIDVKRQIEQTGCPILGTVLNMVDYDNYMGRKYYYKSYSSSYYKSYEKTDVLRTPSRHEKVKLEGK